MPKNNNPEQNDDITLMLKVKNGNHSAFTLLHQKHKKKILNYFRYHYNPYPYLSAEDYTQEVFLRLWENRENYRPDTEAEFCTYLFAIAKNFRKNLYRKKKKEYPNVSLNAIEDDKDRPFQIADPKNTDPSQILLQKEEDTRLKEAIDSLPEKQREIFSLKEYNGFSYKEIARILGCPLGTVRSRKNLAKKKLKEKFKDRIT